MNNTKKTLAIVAVLTAATLVVGLTVAAATQSAFAGREGNRNGNTITILKAQNKGFASGFDTSVNQEAENLICTHPGDNATCTSG
jgi:hypothetical protein